MKMCDWEVTSRDRASMVENPPVNYFFEIYLFIYFTLQMPIYLFSFKVTDAFCQPIDQNILTIHNCWCYVLHYMEDSFFCNGMIKLSKRYFWCYILYFMIK